MTLTEITTRIQNRLDESNSNSQRYTTAALEEYVADGERFYVAKTGVLSNTTTITQVPSTLMYDLPTDCTQVNRVTWNSGGIYRPVEHTTVREMDRSYALAVRWQDQVGTRACHYFIFGLNKIALHPLLQSGTESYIIHYQQDVPSSAVASESTPVEDHELLVNYGLARCLLSERKARPGAHEYKVFVDGVERAKRRRANIDRVWSMSGQRGLQ